MLSWAPRTAVLAILAWGAACAPEPAQPARACLAGLSACGTTCIDLQRDLVNCGACGNACDASQECSLGRCAARCEEPLQACAGAERCVDVASDAAHCGACSRACADGETCVLGTCRVGCAAGWARCGDACVDTRVDGANCGACGRACEAGLACAAGACVPQSAVVPPSLLVSLTADDTLARQFDVMAPLLEANGLRATFYVNAGRLDLAGHGYLTSAQVAVLQSLGHEIGSHGLTHQHLVLLETPPERIEREICDSRAELLARGLAVRAFSYPFGARDAFAAETASACGYLSARDVGNLSPSSGISSESVPPGDPFALRAASSVTPATPFDDVTGLVLDAERDAAAKGAPGWLVINFHDLCPGAACNGLAWDDELFSRFATWLAARAPLGTVVRTVSQVVAGPLAPPVASAERFAIPLVINGGFESALRGDGSPPDCWSRSQTGSHSAAWSRVPGRTGVAEQLTITDYVAGGSSLLQDRGTSAGPDYRSCGTPVTPGHTYTFRCWYRSDVRVSLSLYRNDATHGTSAWLLSPSSPASPDAWALKSFTVTIPDGFNTVFFGPVVSSVCTSGCLNGANTATALVDDCSANDDG